MNKPILNIKATDKVTHSRRIAIGSLIEVFKAHSGAPEQATVIWPGSVGVPPFDAREVEIIWTDDEATKNRQPKNDDNSEEIAQIPVPTGDVQVGDLVMVRRLFEVWDQENSNYKTIVGEWLPEIVKEVGEKGGKGHGHFENVPGTISLHTRHLTDEERAQIKRI